MALNDIYKISLVGSYHGHITVNTFHYKQNSGDFIPVDDNAALAASFNTTVTDNILEVQSADYATIRVEVQKVWPLPVLIHTEHPGAANGQIATDGVPDTVALVVKKKSTIAGRKNRGRIFVPAVAQSLYTADTGFFTNDARFTTLADSLDDPLAPAGGLATFTPVIWSLSRGNDYTPVEFGAFDRVPRSQRRREIGVGA